MESTKLHKDLQVNGNLLGLVHFLEREHMQRKISKKSTEAMARWNIKKLNGYRDIPRQC